MSYSTKEQISSTVNDQSEMEPPDIAHLAGLLDGAGVIAARVGKDETAKLDYRFRPVVEIPRPIEDEVTLGKLDAYAEDRGVRYNIPEKETTAIFRVTDEGSIDRLLEYFFPWLTTTHDAAVVMVEDILPAIDAEKHKTRKGFHELVGYAEEIRELQWHRRDMKYDQEHFEEEWDL